MIGRDHRGKQFSNKSIFLVSIPEKELSCALLYFMIQDSYESKTM